MPTLVVESGRTGWYLRVLETGDVECGDALTLVDRPFARWTIDAVNAVRYCRVGTADIDAARELARCPALAESWRGKSGTLPIKYRADELVCSHRRSREAGMPRDRARMVADVIVEADLLGHDTHGLDQLAGYLVQIQEGRLRTSGDPEVVSDVGACLTWDGRRLPGHWLVKQAIAEARHRILSHPIVTVVIGRGHHIGCLRVFEPSPMPASIIVVYVLVLRRPPASSRRGVHRASRDTDCRGIPTGGDPILVDMSSSTSTNAMNKRLASRGERLKGPWIVDADGRATDDPRVLSGDRPGAMLPLGGLELGHKGFSLALIVEALTSGLAGRGRSEKPESWTASVFVADRSRCVWRARCVRARIAAPRPAVPRHPVAPGNPPVRLPGEGALSRRRRHIREGVQLHETILPALKPWAERFGVPLPKSLAELGSRN